MKIGRLMLRAAVGGFFIGHGTQKLFGWFGGHGLKATSENFEKMGLKPGIVHAGAGAAAETLGGAGLLLGYRTPLASASIVSVMLTAINRVHLKNGPWASKGGYEYNVVLAAAALSLAESGPGSISLDALRGKEREGARWGLLSLALGTAGAAGAHLLAQSRATPEPAATAEPVAAPTEPQPAASADEDGHAGEGDAYEPEAAPHAEQPVAGAEGDDGAASEDA